MRVCTAAGALSGGRYKLGAKIGDKWPPVLDAENAWIEIGNEDRHGWSHDQALPGTRGAGKYGPPAWGVMDTEHQHSHVKGFVACLP